YVATTENIRDISDSASVTVFQWSISFSTFPAFASSVVRVSDQLTVRLRNWIDPATVRYNRVPRFGRPPGAWLVFDDRRRAGEDRVTDPPCLLDVVLTGEAGRHAVNRIGEELLVGAHLSGRFVLAHSQLHRLAAQDFAMNFHERRDGDRLRRRHAEPE